MSENTKENINIFLNTKEKQDTILAESSAHEKYIIMMNDHLHHENQEMKTNIADLHSNIDELEIDNNHMEQSRTHMKGLLKNLNEINKLYKQVKTHDQTIINETLRVFKAFKFRATKHLRFLEGCLFLFLGIWNEYHYWVDSIMVLWIFLIIIAFQESTIWNFKMPNFSQENSNLLNLQKEINDIEKGQDYIYELIENL